MYSSLTKIDAVSSDPDRFVQTDHRERAEIEADPEISVLFALTRVLNARKYAETKSSDGRVVYVSAAASLPPFLLEVLAACGAMLERMEDRLAIEPPATAATPGELADQAFRALAQRVSRRCGLTDFAAVLRAVEAETLADPPVLEEDEPAYWTRVLELAAVVCEVVRARHGGRWQEHDRAVVPFGFSIGDGNQVVLPTNRAQRFISDGEPESMFLLLAPALETTEDGPVLPNLRARSEAIAENMAFRPLLEGLSGDHEDVPVIVYGTDRPTSFAIMTNRESEDLEAVHAQALENLAAQEVSVDPIEGDGIKLLVVSGNYYASEKLLDARFMRDLHRRTGQELLCVVVPRRGLMFVGGRAPGDRDQLVALRAIAEKEASTTRSISTAILLVQGGAVVGRVSLEPVRGGDPEPPPAKKPGLLGRLFGRKK
ncbi:MAG: hypothetical protein ACTHU0_36870 [Kofleriaceae bacterium]